MIGCKSGRAAWTRARAPTRCFGSVRQLISLYCPAATSLLTQGSNRASADKACIDQLNIDESLKCLPVFLSGCQQLLLLVGPTYTSRLWCVMELFVWVRMGGEREAMEVMLLDQSAAADYASHLSRFDAGKAKCFLDGDKQRLWAVIEASFGTFEPFNALVKGIFAAELQEATRREATQV